MAVDATMKWDTNLYDNKYDFVFKYGEDLVQLLSPKKGECILDVGCGTGYLTNIIAASGAYTVGIDSSETMIEKARATYSDIDFRVASATVFSFDKLFDAVFSNAVLHWILEKEKAIANIFRCLKSNGRLVAELGGKDNIQGIIAALKQVLQQHGYIANASLNVWYFPSLGEYTTLLEQSGFVVNYAAYFKRETALKDNEQGIKNWIKMFGSPFLKGIDEPTTDTLLDEVQKLIKTTHYRNNTWYADYKRLRIVATKP